MNATASDARRQVFNEINITPLTDIFLVLLIIMMVVAPMMQSLRGDIKPPSVQGGQPVDQSKIAVEVSKSGEYFLNGKSVPVASLSEALEKAVPLKSAAAGAAAGSASKELSTRVVVVRADKQARSGAVLKVFEAARDAHFQKVIIAGQKLRADDPFKPQAQGDAF
ncbi:MAG: biopolymer transporter ExbD [Vampirovibrionales bacterium]|nr:biopolymer transporter ExbD [Vampirovibrionales bacterium]